MRRARSRFGRRPFLQSGLVLLGAGVLTGCAVGPFQTGAPSGMPRVGLLQFSTEVEEAIEAFRRGLAELGYVEGRNLTLDVRYAEGRLDRIMPLATELAALHPDVVVVANSEAVRAVQEVSNTIAIVFPAMQDPVERGLISSLARPGGNVTGLAITAGLEAAKRLELLKQTIPSLSRVAIVWDHSSEHRHRETLVAAQALRVEHLSLELEDTGDIDTVLASAPRAHGDGLIIMGSFRFSALAPRIVDFAARHRLPAMYSIITSARRGGLMAYAPNIVDNFRRSAVYVDKILKGARPSDLPVELPTTFDFIINQTTAQALGLTIPQSVLQQATEVIQ
jgi:putative tryptophan/tyrosine transport system substrate-binding protein